MKLNQEHLTLSSVQSKLKNIDIKKFMQGLMMIFAFYTIHFTAYLATFSLDTLGLVDTTSLLGHSFELTTYFLLCHVLVTLYFTFFDATKLQKLDFISPIDPNSRSTKQKLTLITFSFSHAIHKYILNDISKFVITTLAFVILYVKELAYGTIALTLCYSALIFMYLFINASVSISGNRAMYGLEELHPYSKFKAIINDIKSRPVGSHIKTFGTIIIFFSALLGVSKAKVVQMNPDIEVNNVGNGSIVASTSSGVIIHFKDKESALSFISWKDLSSSTQQPYRHGLQKLIDTVYDNTVEDK